MNSIFMKLLFSAAAMCGLAGEQMFYTSGTFTWPNGVTSGTVEAGGGGAGGGNGTSNAKGGGGGGAYSKKNNVTKTAATAEVIVGAAGGVGQDGGNSTFSQNDIWYCKAMGGTAGYQRIGGTGGSAAFGIGDVKYAGGDGRSSTGSATGGGGGGGAATSTADGSIGHEPYFNEVCPPTGEVACVGGGSYYGGKGGNGAPETPTDGDSAKAYLGGGGGGGGKTMSSGNGTPGYVYVTWQSM